MKQTEDKGQKGQKRTNRDKKGQKIEMNYPRNEINNNVLRKPIFDTTKNYYYYTEVSKGRD